MKKRSIKFEVNFTNKWFYTFIVLGVFIVLSAGVFSYRSGKSPAVIGHSAEEIEGLEEFVVEIVQREMGGASVPSNVPLDYSPCDESFLVWDSHQDYGFFGIESGYNIKGYRNVKLPSSCFSDTGCKITQKVYFKAELVSTKTCIFKQDSSSGSWTCSFASSSENTQGINGDRAISKIFPDYHPTILFWDDESNTDFGPTGFFLKDDSSSYAQKAYIC